MIQYKTIIKIISVVSLSLATLFSNFYLNRHHFAIVIVLEMHFHFQSILSSFMINE